VEVRSRVLGAASREALDAQHALGVVRYARGPIIAAAAYAEVQAPLKAAYDGRSLLLGAGDGDTLRTLQFMATCAVEHGKAAAGEALTRFALQGLEATLGADHPLSLNTLFSLADVCLFRGDHAAAAPLFRRALEACVAGPLGEEHEKAVMCRDHLGQCLLHLERPAEAEPLFRRMAELSTAKHGAAHESSLSATLHAGICLCQQGQKAEALEVLRPALAIARTALPPDSDTRLQLVVRMVQAAVGLGHTPEMLALAKNDVPPVFAALGPNSRERAILAPLVGLPPRAFARGAGRGRGRRR